MKPLVGLSQLKTIRLKPVGPINEVPLEKDYAYIWFNSNDNFLTWYEAYTHVLFVYNLKNKNLLKISLEEGKGPHEIEQIEGLSINKNNIIYLLDSTNIKFIRVSTSGSFLSDQYIGSGLRPIRMTAGNGYLVVMDANSRKALFFLKGQQGYDPIRVKDDYVNKIKNYFKKLGWTAIQNNLLIQVREYLGTLYVYNLKNKKLVERINFDDSAADWGKLVHRKNGQSFMYPPKKANFISRDIARVPGLPHRVFLLIKGASNKRTYGLNKIFEYDFVKEKFITAHKLGVKVNEIAVNNHTLFAYSKDQNKIYQYKIVQKK